MLHGSGWRIAGRALVVPIIIGTTLWGALALLYTSELNAQMGGLLVGAFSFCGFASALAVVLRRREIPALVGFAVLAASLLV